MIVVSQDLLATCAWNRTWVPATLDPCAVISCTVIPFPPPDIGLVYVEVDSSTQVESCHLVFQD